MDAQILNITSRERRSVSVIATLDNFTVTEGDAFDAQQIVENPNVSPYCFDHDRQRVIFAELPAGIDLAQAPFYYQAQFDHAQRLIAVPYATFHELAGRIEVDFSRLICIHNIGRCGSTLLSQVFNEVESVVSLSEPDVFGNMIALRHEPRADLMQLIHSSTRFVFRPAVTGSATTFALKFRNQCVDLMDLFFEAFPDAKHLFLYRDAMGWLASVYRLIIRGGPVPPMSRAEAIERQAQYLNRDRAEIEHLFDSAMTSVPVIVYLAVGWLVMMRRYVELYGQGFQPLAARYEDLNQQREAVIANIFDYCNLPSEQVTAALRAFDRDSQAETRLARDSAEAGNKVQIPDDLVAQIEALLRQQPVINDSDYALPGTLMV